MQTTITTFDRSAEGWERALYAFLAEKERRSGSRRTVEGYSRMLQHFFAGNGKPPDRVTSPEVFAWAYGVGLSGKQPSSVTIGARLACLSSFFHFLIRMGVVTSNPCDALERPRLQVAPPRGLNRLTKELLEHVVTEARPCLREHAVVWRRQIEVVAQEPVVAQVQAHLLGQAPFGRDAVEVAQQQHLEDDDRIDGWLTGVAVVGAAEGPDEGEVDGASDAPQQMVLGVPAAGHDVNRVSEPWMKLGFRLCADEPRSR